MGSTWGSIRPGSLVPIALLALSCLVVIAPPLARTRTSQWNDHRRCDAIELHTPWGIVDMHVPRIPIKFHLQEEEQEKKEEEEMSKLA